MKNSKKRTLAGIVKESQFPVLKEIGKISGGRGYERTGTNDPPDADEFDD